MVKRQSRINTFLRNLVLSEIIIDVNVSIDVLKILLFFLCDRYVGTFTYTIKTFCSCVTNNFLPPSMRKRT